MLGPVAGVPHIALPMYALAYLFVGMTVFGYAGNIYRFAAHGDPLMKGMN